jgi:hypothetical protein
MNYRLLCMLTLKWAWLCVSKEWTYTLLTSKQLTLIEVLKPDNTGAGSLLLFVLGLLIVIKAIKKFMQKVTQWQFSIRGSSCRLKMRIRTLSDRHNYCGVCAIKFDLLQRK